MAGSSIPRDQAVPSRKWLVRAFVRSEVVDRKRKKVYTSKSVDGTHARAAKILAGGHQS